MSDAEQRENLRRAFAMIALADGRSLQPSFLEQMVDRLTVIRPSTTGRLVYTLFGYRSLTWCHAHAADLLNAIHSATPEIDVVEQ